MLFATLAALLLAVVISVVESYGGTKCVPEYTPSLLADSSSVENPSCIKDVTVTSFTYDSAGCKDELTAVYVKGFDVEALVFASTGSERVTNAAIFMGSREQGCFMVINRGDNGLFSLSHKYSRWHLAEGWPQFDDCTEFQTQTNAKGISQYNKRGRICSRTWLSNTYKDIQNTFYMTIWIKRSTYKTSRFIVFFNTHRDEGRLELISKKEFEDPHSTPPPTKPPSPTKPPPPPPKTTPTPKTTPPSPSTKRVKTTSSPPEATSESEYTSNDESGSGDGDASGVGDASGAKGSDQTFKKRRAEYERWVDQLNSVLIGVFIMGSLLASSMAICFIVVLVKRQSRNKY